jgi:type IV pilus assembly protein PilM
VAVIDLGASIMNITVLRNDQAVYAREQAFGGNQLTQDIARHYGLSPEEAENAKRSGGLPDSYDTEVLRPFMENAALEIQRAMQFFFTSTQFNSIEHILLTGGTSTLQGLEDMVSSRTRVNAMVANPFANMSISPRIQLKRLISDAPALMIACGLAMRRFDE